MTVFRRVAGYALLVGGISLALVSELLYVGGALAVAGAWTLIIWEEEPK